MELIGHDQTTDIKSFRIEQYDVNNAITEIVGKYTDMASFSTWFMNGSDGSKFIQARFKDYGNNVVVDNINSEFFRTYIDSNNEPISRFLIHKLSNDSFDIWTAFGGSSPQLYLNTNFASLLYGEATAMAVFNDTFYIAIKDSVAVSDNTSFIVNKGILQRFTAGSISTVVDNTSPLLSDGSTLNSLYVSDSIINDMAVFDESLFLGMENGQLLRFNGSTISLVNSDYQFESSIHRLGTDGKVLYIFLENSEDISVMQKDINGSYVFSRIEIEAS